MSGGNISYNIRPNKFVERKLFLELLRIACPENEEKYVYVSMGGPQLQDLTDLHFELGWKNLISLEYDGLVFERQKFNARPGCLECLNIKTGDFIEQFDSYATKFDRHQFVIWLDFADSKKRAEQLNEYSQLVSVLDVGDIVKITMNANLETIKAKVLPNETLDEFEKRRLNCLKVSLGDYSPRQLSSENLNYMGFVKAICEAIDTASTKSLEHKRNLAKLPLSIFLYNDGNHPMVTYTIKIVKGSGFDSEREDLRKRWKYLPSSPIDFSELNIPNLSLKERIFIESLLFSKKNHSELHAEIPFKFAQAESTSLEILGQYIEHYRRYPGYVPMKM